MQWLVYDLHVSIAINVLYEKKSVLLWGFMKGGLGHIVVAGVAVTWHFQKYLYLEGPAFGKFFVIFWEKFGFLFLMLKVFLSFILAFPFPSESLG